MGVIPIHAIVLSVFFALFFFGLGFVCGADNERGKRDSR